MQCMVAWYVVLLELFSFAALLFSASEGPSPKPARLPLR